MTQVICNFLPRCFGQRSSMIRWYLLPGVYLNKIKTIVLELMLNISYRAEPYDPKPLTKNTTRTIKGQGQKHTSAPNILHKNTHYRKDPRAKKTRWHPTSSSLLSYGVKKVLRRHVHFTIVENRSKVEVSLFSHTKYISFSWCVLLKYQRIYSEY